MKKFSHSRPVSLALLALPGVGVLAPLTAAHAAAYPTAVLQDAPAAYYRFEDAPKGVVNLNSGSLGAAGNATNLNVYSVSGALAGNGNPGGYFDGTGGRAIIPFQAALNPPANTSFTIESWVNTSVEVTDSPGPAPLMNRYSYSGVNRQGWVFFQRSPTTGWNFRTYIGTGSSTGINITGQASTPGAGTAGTWSHLVATWDGPTTTARLYVNGEKVAEATGGYVANTDDHPVEEAVRGAAGISVGSYNNTEPGSNPFHGKVDEVALYAKRLSDAEVLSHYQNGTNANRTTAYDALIKSLAPVAYLRFDESSPTNDQAINIGSAGPSGNGVNGDGVLHPAAGAVADGLDGANAYRSKGTGGGTTTVVPWSAKLNPEGSLPFTVESWFYVAQEVTDAPGPAPLMNRYSYSGADRQGWVYFQRSPTTGWNFRTYTGAGSATGVNITGQSSDPNAGKAGTWNHVVTTWDGTTATLFVNGEQVAQGTGGYAANTDDHDPAQAVRGPSGLGIGSYNNTQPGDNAFTGRVDEVAVYADVLGADRILAHYQNGTNALRTLPYEAEVLADKPVEFLRFDEPAFNPVANSGTAGASRNGAVVFPRATANGPSGTAFPGLETDNHALAFDAQNSFESLGNPSGPTLAKKFSAEAWIRPDAAQGTVANVLARVPSLGDEDDLFLRIVDGTSYEFGTVSLVGEDLVVRSVKAPAPAADLNGSTWTHLTGTYDGTKWSLYRNGVLLGTTPDTTGMAAALETDWAIGSRGDGIGRLFAGAIDEVALYSQALTEAQIQAHYAAATVAPSVSVPLTIVRNGNNIAVSWTGAGVLQAASTVNGTYEDVAGAASPAKLPTGSAAQYFRLRK